MDKSQNYATKLFAEVLSNGPSSIGDNGDIVKPVFLKHNEFAKSDPNAAQISGPELLKAMADVIDPKGITGIQRIRGLWRLYVNDNVDRIILLTGGINMRGRNVMLCDENPFLTAKRETSDRIIVRNLPLSADDSIIEGTLDELGLKVKAIKRAKWRIDGRLTNIDNGDRFVFVEKLQKPLPSDWQIRMGPFLVNVIYRERQHPGPQDGTSTNADPCCYNCLQRGHRRSECRNPVVCRLCNKSGHIRAQCPALSVPSSHGSGQTAAAIENDVQARGEMTTKVQEASEKSSDVMRTGKKDMSIQPKITAFVSDPQKTSKTTNMDIPSDSKRKHISTSTELSTSTLLSDEDVLDSDNDRSMSTSKDTRGDNQRTQRKAKKRKKAQRRR